ncbi:OLC1v1037877C1 [Oldenlandia corymbosa var. corymbosa]|uniref:OLC1v1037877C1 n=1 Tax=Oldenlandia corymbosa var. corymbosa TaxID=529605 RepID=A0AAV1CZ30_OLDCO|nr:OLC1v1037877C1 [Oldenlandia corymbosa var. corymbosa]
MDRKLYYLLAVELWRDLYESAQILSFWLWIEQLGFKKFISFLLSLHPPEIDEYADEAVTCLRCMKNHRFVIRAEGNVLPLTSSLLNHKISLQFFHENRATTVRELHKIVSELCVKVLPDLIEDAFKKHAIFDSLTDDLASLGFVDEKSVRNRRAGTSTEDRALFITFSKGYPVSEADGRGFFAALFGDCFEACYMQSANNAHDQPVYAKVVFSSRATIDQILNDAAKAKFKNQWEASLGAQVHAEIQDFPIDDDFGEETLAYLYFSFPICLIFSLS